MCLFYSLCRTRHIALNTCFFPRLSGTRKIQHEGNNINRKFFESNVRHIKLLSKNEMTKIRLKYKWEPMQHSRAWITVHSGWSTREQATEPMARWLRVVGEQVQNILLQILSNILNCCKNFECMIWQLRQRKHEAFEHGEYICLRQAKLQLRVRERESMPDLKK